MAIFKIQYKVPRFTLWCHSVPVPVFTPEEKPTPCRTILSVLSQSIKSSVPNAVEKRLYTSLYQILCKFMKSQPW